MFREVAVQRRGSLPRLSFRAGVPSERGTARGSECRARRASTSRACCAFMAATASRSERTSFSRRCTLTRSGCSFGFASAVGAEAISTAAAAAAVQVASGMVVFLPKASTPATRPEFPLRQRVADRRGEPFGVLEGEEVAAGDADGAGGRERGEEALGGGGEEGGGAVADDDGDGGCDAAEVVGGEVLAGAAVELGEEGDGVGEEGFAGHVVEGGEA